MARFEHESRTVQADEDRRRGNPVPLAPVARAAPSPASRRPARWRPASLAVIYAISASMAAISPAAAQNLPLIRDTEIENLLKDYSIPIFKAAGLGSQNIAMRIVNHESFNAFVVDGHNVFINTGTLMQAKTPNEVIGVIAHETGHIVGGHLAALRSRIARDATKSLLLTVLGIGLMVGGALAGGDSARDISGAGGGLAMGGNDMLMRSMLSERRAQESAADQSGLRLLEATRQSGRGMLITFERFAEQEFWSQKDLDPFVRSHPVAAHRLNQLREKVTASPYANDKDPPQLQHRHDMMRAKLEGHVLAPQIVYNRYPANDTSLPARYARAIARNCSGGCVQAMQEIDALIRDRPDNPYFWELKGELYVKAGQATQAIEPLRRAVALLEKLKRANPSMSLSQTNILLARALVSANDESYLDEAIKILTLALGADKPLWQGDDDDWMGWYQLAIAFQRKGNEAEALLATARKHFYSGNAKDIRDAQIYAKRAQTKFARGSRGWLIAEDIITYKIPT
jgi:predicted Zn-dependent protease